MMSVSSDTTDDRSAGHKAMELLGRQLNLYQRIEQLAEAQRRLIEGDDSRPLLRLLSERQKLTAELTRLNHELAPYRQRWEALKVAMLPSERRAMEEMVKKAAARLRRILEKDEADGQLLAAKKSRARHDIGTLGTAQRTLAAYAGNTTQQPSILESTEA
ncbi:MAG: hypothetical protein KAV82_12285 [Phycisphaerae bacterium]|nr:hypothetical protein [Phycisphaerae bacterium]